MIVPYKINIADLRVYLVGDEADIHYVDCYLDFRPEGVLDLEHFLI